MYYIIGEERFSVLWRVGDVQAVRGLSWSREAEARDEQVESWVNETRNQWVRFREKRGWGVPAGVPQDGPLGIELAVDPCARREEEKGCDPSEVLPPLPMPGGPAPPPVPGGPALLPMLGASAPVPTSLPLVVPALLSTSAPIFLPLADLASLPNSTLTPVPLATPASALQRNPLPSRRAPYQNTGSSVKTQKHLDNPSPTTTPKQGNYFLEDKYPLEPWITL